jgi:hypothetical protein
VELQLALYAFLTAQDNAGVSAAYVPSLRMAVMKRSGVLNMILHITFCVCGTWFHCLRERLYFMLENRWTRNPMEGDFHHTKRDLKEMREFMRFRWGPSGGLLWAK